MKRVDVWKFGIIIDYVILSVLITGSVPSYYQTLQITRLPDPKQKAWYTLVTISIYKHIKSICKHIFYFTVSQPLLLEAKPTYFENPIRTICRF
jgi:hypothetical protein